MARAKTLALITVIVMTTGTEGYPFPEQWLIDILPDNSVLGMDPKLVSIGELFPLLYLHLLTWNNYITFVF